MNIIFGPVLTDQDGNLRAPIRMCRWGDTRCTYSGVHDWHYFYCAAQPQTHHPNYPWPGAGRQLSAPKPDQRCPYFPDSVPVTPEEDAMFSEMAKR